MPLTVLLPKNAYSSALEEMLTPLLPLGSVFADPERDLEGLQGRRLLLPWPWTREAAMKRTIICSPGCGGM